MAFVAVIGSRDGTAAAAVLSAAAAVRGSAEGCAATVAAGSGGGACCRFRFRSVVTDALLAFLDEAVVARALLGAFSEDSLVTARVVGLDADAPSMATAGVLAAEVATPGGVATAGGVTGAVAEAAAVNDRSDCLEVAFAG